MIQAGVEHQRRPAGGIYIYRLKMTTKKFCSMTIDQFMDFWKLRNVSYPVVQKSSEGTKVMAQN
jgi:hypothetical protein